MPARRALDSKDSAKVALSASTPAFIMITDCPGLAGRAAEVKFYFRRFFHSISC
jgi:hypothetical protein